MAIWITVTLLAALLTPMDDSRAVQHVPILAPIMIGIAISYESVPVRAKLWRIPMDAAELWMIPVTTVPARTPRSGFLNAVIILVNSSVSLRGAMDPDIMVIPCMRIAKPRSIVPISLRFCFLDTITMSIPISAKIREKHFGSRSLRNTLPDELIPDSERIHAVSVVPMSDPKITPTV